MHKSNFTHTCKKCITFREEIFTELVHAQQHYLQIAYTEFHPSRAIHVESTGRIHVFPQVKHGFPCTNFHATHKHTINFWRHPLYQRFLKTRKNMQKICAQFPLSPFKCGFYCINFHNIHKYCMVTSNMIYIQLHPNIPGKSKSRVKIPIFLQVKYDSQNQCSNFCEEILYHT